MRTLTETFYNQIFVPLRGYFLHDVVNNIGQNWQMQEVTAQNFKRTFVNALACNRELREAQMERRLSPVFPIENLGRI